MSDADIPDAAADLLDAERDDFDSVKTFRDFVDEQLAEIQADADRRDDRLNEQGARVEALSRRTQRALDAAEKAQQRADHAERMAAWGGLGYEDRIETVVSTLINYARENGGHGFIATTEHDFGGEGHRRVRPGIVDLFDGAVSPRTCRTYIDDLGQCAGLSVEDRDVGGWGGGSEPKRLKLDLRAFFAAYGSEWDGDDLAADMGGRDDE